MQGSSPSSSDLPASKCVSNESMQSSSGVSSTGSLPYGGSLVRELDLLDLDGEGLQNQVYHQLVLKEFSRNVKCILFSLSYFPMHMKQLQFWLNSFHILYFSLNRHSLIKFNPGQY